MREKENTGMHYQLFGLEEKEHHTNIDFWASEINYVKKDHKVKSWFMRIFYPGFLDLVSSFRSDLVFQGEKDISTRHWKMQLCVVKNAVFY